MVGELENGSTELGYTQKMQFVKGIAAIILGAIIATLFGVAAGFIIGAALIAAPLVLIYHLLHRGSKSY